MPDVGNTVNDNGTKRKRETTAWPKIKEIHRERDGQRDRYRNLQCNVILLHDDETSEIILQCSITITIKQHVLYSM